MGDDLGRGWGNTIRFTGFVVLFKDELDSGAADAVGYNAICVRRVLLTERADLTREMSARCELVGTWGNDSSHHLAERLSRYGLEVEGGMKRRGTDIYMAQQGCIPYHTWAKGHETHAYNGGKA